MKTKPKKILVLSDLHCGAIPGLTPPGWHCKEYAFLQVPLWSWYVAAVKKIGPVDILVVNGDAVDGEGKSESIGHLTTDTEEQAEIAERCIRQIKFGKLFFAYGTPFHTAGTYSYENTVAKAFDAPIKDTIYLEVNGVKFSFRHVTGNSATPYTMGTQLLKEVTRDLFDAINSESEEADVVVRSHVHNFLEVRNARRIGITTPCLQIPESVFGRKCRAWAYDVGMLEIDVYPGGKVAAEPHIMPLKIVKKREYQKV